MPLTEGDFKSIRTMIDSMVGRSGEYFVTGTVIRRDVARKLVWLAEFGDQPIPIVGFDYSIKTYDTDETGTVQVRTGKATVLVPEIGEVVVVARELGTRRLPRCLGVIQGTGWITPPEN